MKVNENSVISLPIRNLIALCAAVAMGIFAYTEITARLTSLETSRELHQADLLKKSEQLPTDQEQFMLLEHMAIQLEKITTRVDDMMHNKVMIESINKVLDKATKDIDSRNKEKKDEKNLTQKEIWEKKYQHLMSNNTVLK